MNPFVIKRVSNKSMILTDVEVKPIDTPAQTYLFIKCLGLGYAKDFIEKGSIKFATLSSWCRLDGTSRGDIMEGVYASQRGFEPRLDELLRMLRKDTFSINNDGFTFYKSKEVLSFRAFCLYGLNDNNMPIQTVRSQDHQFHRLGIVTKGFFQKLFPDVTEDDIESLEEKERPAVLFIRPDSFISFITEKLLEKGVKEEEIFIRPISYIDYYKKPFIIGAKPEELFIKRSEYSEQSEIRIVIDSLRKEVQELFDNDGVIELGPIPESVASISEYYFKDMHVEIRGNKLFYEFAQPQSYLIDDIDDVSLIVILQQALSDELPGAPMSIEKIEDEINRILQILRQCDTSVKYDRLTNIIQYKGKSYNLGLRAGYKMLEHYNNYILDNDINGAGDTIAKFKHFFPLMDMGNYFRAYYKALGLLSE